MELEKDSKIPLFDVIITLKSGNFVYLDNLHSFDATRAADGSLSSIEYVETPKTFNRCLFIAPDTIAAITYSTIKQVDNE